jgi:anti-anti-sigma regulatory factor
MPDTPFFARPVAVRPGEHACCRFAAAEDRCRAAVSVVIDGLRRNRKVIYLRDGESAETLLARLADVDRTTLAAAARGQLELYSSAQASAPDGSLDVDRMLSWLCEQHELALADGYAGMTITGELGPAFSDATGARLMQEYERRLDGLRFSGSVRLCQYHAGHFDDATLATLADSHDVDLAPELAGIGRTGTLAAARVRHGWLRLAGELDSEVAAEVTATLEEDFDDELNLDLADLSFVDVAGMRALRGPGPRRVRIAGTSPAVDRLLDLLGWDTDPCVTVEEAP